MEQIYRVDETKAVSETIDGETIVINLQNGNYYSLNGTASALWDQLRVARSYADVLRHFLARYSADETQISPSLKEGIAFLNGDGLLAEVSGQDRGSTPEWSGSKEIFTPIVIERYQDMQEMLLADPIHDVDDIGWPTLKRQS